MQILPVKYNFNNNNTSIRPKSEYLLFMQEKQVNFYGANTSAGNPLKKLKKPICAYFNVEMLSSNELASVEKRLDKCTTLKESVDILKKYKKNMLKIEKKIFKRFEEYSKRHPNTQMQDCLKLWYDEAITKLKLDEFKVLDDIDKISLHLSPENALSVHAETTYCRQVILENRREDTFKRKTLLNALDNIHINKSEKNVFEKLSDRAVYLPTSGTSENAFIVKYAERSHQEISKRLLRPSVETVEHIKPNSKSGENTMSNFLLACAGANNLRSNMPLYKFIDMFPNIPKNCQKYINQIIDFIHKGMLRGNESYPYKVKKTLAKESKGRIMLDLSKYQYSLKTAKKIEKIPIMRTKSRKTQKK